MKPEKPPKTSTSRVEAHEKNLLARGGRRLSGIKLQPEAAESLADLEAKGESATAAINRLLIEEAGQSGDKYTKG
ncbi:hypothetical protein D3C81_2164740 [compost metagenome]